MPTSPLPSDHRHWRSWVSRHCTPAVVVVVGGTLALGVAASEYGDHQRAQRNTRLMYRGLLDGLGAVADLQYEIQEARHGSQQVAARVSAIVRQLSASSESGEDHRAVQVFEQAWTDYLRGRDDCGSTASARPSPRSRSGSISARRRRSPPSTRSRGAR